jgi:hypothetical protein
MILFSQLVQNFPHEAHPCRTAAGQSRYANQCAIRMSIALLGVDPTFLAGFRGNVCPHGHVRGAPALARYLDVWLARSEHPTHRQDIQGQGILFYQRPEHAMPHIDLWTTNMCLPRWDPGVDNTMGWTTLDATELSFWRLPQ